MEEVQYCRIKGKTRILHLTPTLAKRLDVVMMNEKRAKVMLDGIRTTKKLMNEETPPEVISSERERVAKLNELAKDEARAEAEAEAQREAILEKAATDGRDKKPEPKQKAKSPEEQEEMRRQRKIDKDPQVGNIRMMKSKKDVIAYLAREHGVDETESKSLDDLKDLAVAKRTEILFEDE